MNHIKALVEKRQRSKALRLGTYEKIFVKNEQLAFSRKYEGKQYNLLLQGKTSWIGGIS